MANKGITIYCHFSFRRPKGKTYGLFAVAFYLDEEGKILIGNMTRKLPLWENHQFVTAIQSYEHALYSIYSNQGLLRSRGITNVMLVTDNSTLAGWIDNPKKNKAYTGYMNKAVQAYRAGGHREITLSIGLCEARHAEKSYKFCKEEKVINDIKPIKKTDNGKRVLDLDMCNITLKTVSELEKENSNMPDIIGI